MEIINTLLSQYKNLQPPERHIKSALQGAIMDVCGVRVAIGDISIQNHIAFITVPSVYKAELYEHEKSILAVAKNKAGEKFAITAIR